MCIYGAELLPDNIAKCRDNLLEIFAEWGCLGKGKFQRRDLRFDVLTHSSAFSAEDSLFAHLGKHEIFTPIKTYHTRTFTPVSSRCGRNQSANPASSSEPSAKEK